MRKGVDLIYKLNGDIEEGINVFELSPILLSFGKLINEAHNILYPDDKEVAVNIKPFQKGSFEINILMFPKDHVQQLINFVNSDRGKNITAVLTYLGFISQFSGVTLIQVISYLKGKLKRVEPLDSGEYRYYSDDTSSIVVTKEVNALYQNCHIQQTIYNGFAKPLELNNVESIESFIKNDEEKTKVVYNKEIVPSIKAYSAAEMPINEQEESVENVRTIWVQPKRVSVEGEKNSWSFRTGPDNIMTANICDDSFLEKIKDGSIRLSHTDRLLVEVTEKQNIRGINVTISNDITKVKKYVKGPEQEELKFD